MRAGTGKSPAVWAGVIVAVSAVLGLLVDWRAPGIARYAHDLLVRARGPLPAPEDIAIVAIDEPSIARFGRFPWSRQVLARTIDTIAAAQPKVIAIDVLFADPTVQDDDDALARSAGRAGNVVVSAQLIESSVHGGPSQWLLPLASIRYAAAGVGHVNVQTESDGAARQIEVRASDDSGQTIRALAVEAVRVADGTPEQAVQYTPRALLLGPRTIPLDASEPPVLITRVEGASGAPVVLHGGRMTIDFIGPRRRLRGPHLQRGRRGGRQHSGRSLSRQVRADRRHRGLDERSHRLPVRARNRSARGSARRTHARRRGAGQ